MKFRFFHAASLPLIAMALLIVMLNSTAFSHNAYLVKDFNAETRSKEFRTKFYIPWIEFKGLAFFTMESKTYGMELFKSDGTVSGTVLVKDVYPGAASSYPEFLTVVGDTLYFAARDEEHGVELWKTDGTDANIMDISPGSASSYARNFYDHDGTLYFSARNSLAGRARLWKSDGTDAGTVMVTRDDPDSPESPRNFASMDGILYFSACNDALGCELWRSDGTAAGTYMVLDAYPGWDSSYPAYLEPLDGILCFLTMNGMSRLNLWRTDGTPEGTYEIKEFEAGLAFRSARINVGDRLFFSAYESDSGYELWTTDGSSTFMVQDIRLGRESSRPCEFNFFRDQVYFIADDGKRGQELRAILPDSLYTHLVQDTNPGPDGVAFEDVVKAGNLLYSITSDGQVFRSDGSPMGTYLIDRSDLISHSNGIIPFGNEIFFAGHRFGRTGLWRSDGTDAGTTPVKLDDPGGTWSITGSEGLQGMAVGRLFLLASDDLRGTEMWSSDGSEAGTIALTDAFPDPTVGSNISQLTAVDGDRVFFFIEELADMSGLWKSDGTEAGTVQVRAFGLEGAETGNFTDVEGTLFFTRDIWAASATELWISDGSEAGTFSISVFYGSSPDMLTSFNGLLYFGADDDVNGPGFWRSDGTQAGTYIIHEVYPHGLTLLDGVLYYSDDDGRLWQSDGTDAGAIRLADIPAKAYEFENSQGMLFFRTSDSGTGSELWKSDLTQAGTLMVKDICPGGCSAYPSGLTDSNDLLFFLAKQDDDPFSQPYLYRSDGTDLGTTALIQLYFNDYGMNEPIYSGYLRSFKDFLFFHDQAGGLLRKTDGNDILYLGPGGKCGYVKYGMTPAGEVMYYSGTSIVMGDELCGTDGEVAGTVVADIWPGSDSSAPEQLILAGSRLFFTADDGIHGRELWAFDIPREDLLRNDLVTSIKPVVTPPLSDLLPLDPVADAYRSDFTSGEKEPEAGVLIDDSRPLIFYGLDADATVRLVKDGQEDIKIFF